MPQKFQKIDHIAIAVRELEPSIEYFTQMLGFTLMRRLSITGKHTGMISAELEMNQIKFVLCQGTEPESQVSRLISHNGPGVAHIALEVDDVASTVDELKSRGVCFATPVVEGPGLKQAFSARDSNSCLSFEFIQRNDEQRFLEDNVKDLFEHLEESASY